MYVYKCLFLLFCLLFTGCGISIAVNSTPNGADVYYDGDHIGKTPIIIKVSDFSEQALVRCEKKGFSPQERIIVKEYITTTSVNTMNACVGGYGHSSSTATGIGTQIQIKGRWPAEIYFELKKIEETK